MKGTVAEGEYRQIFDLVKGNNIRFTVAFAESYRKTDFLQHENIACVSDFLIAEHIGYFFILKRRTVYEKSNF